MRLQDKRKIKLDNICFTRIPKEHNTVSVPIQDIDTILQNSSAREKSLGFIVQSVNIKYLKCGMK